MDVASSAAHVLKGPASHISHRPLYYNKQFNLTLQPFSPVRLLCCYVTSATTRPQCSPLSLRIPVQSLSSSTSYRGWPVEHTSKMLIPCSQCLFQFMTKGVSSGPPQRKRVRGMESRSWHDKSIPTSQFSIKFIFFLCIIPRISGLFHLVHVTVEFRS